MGLLDVFKDGELVETIELSASKRVYKVGRQAGLADIVLSHGSISREQSTLTVSASGSVVVADQGSAHGTFLSGKRLPANKPHLLAPGRSLTFGSSSRIFKLREGTGGFVADVGSAPQDTLNLSAARLLEDPKVQAVLHVLRNGAPDVERPRPDGFVPLHAVLNAASVVRVGCSETELASLPAKLSSVVEASTHDGKLLLRAVDGHARHRGRDLFECASLGRSRRYRWRSWPRTARGDVWCGAGHENFQRRLGARAHHILRVCAQRRRDRASRELRSERRVTRIAEPCWHAPEVVPVRHARRPLVSPSFGVHCGRDQPGFREQGRVVGRDVLS